MLPGDLPNPGGPRPSATPPGALTTLGLHAVDGASSSAGVGLIKLPLTYLAPDIASTIAAAA